ncbi:hypothetical protein Ocin01_00360 [Orchesella cincta]|uniref:G-protein coupled receptors family 1 profile domain-containing protein n=1 Tax=Orchesella cincta TaxID=48709 RepID=A0A1D2NM11_ORCCI|nr:hypothetical protein Ocin01_00360 [Orchesella cincta]
MTILLFGRSSLSMIYGITYLMSVHIVPSISLIRESAKTQKLMKFLKLSNTDNFHQQLQFPIDNRLRLLRNSCLFTTIFLTCWLPYGIFQFPLDLPKEVLPELLELYVRFYFRYVRNICYMQITLTPVVLFALSHDLRMYLARTQCDWRCRVTGRPRRLQRRALQITVEQP